MINKTQTARRMTRIAALAALVAVGGMTAGCSDNDGGGPDGTGGGGGGGGPGVNGGSRSAVANQAAVALAVINQLDAILPAAPAAPAPSAAAAPKAAGQDLCSGGSGTVGTPQNSSAPPGNVPYTEAQSLNYSIATQTIDDCVLLDQDINNPGGNGIPASNTRTRITLDGQIQSGSASTSGYGYGFASLGTEANPLSFDTRINGSAAGHSFDGSSQLDLFLRNDSKSTGEGTEAQIFSSFKFAVVGSSGGASAGDKGTILFGKALSDRFRIGTNAAGTSLAGQYSIDTSACKVTVVIATNTPLTRNGAGQATAGELALTVNGTASTVAYNSDGGVTVTQGSSTQTFTAQELATAQSTERCNAGGIAAFAGYAGSFF
ncbi:hypothetical protein D0B54_17270 [Solimonas sp. K1W22B-7]|uniref:hypothetical protein n=1 Tax=Solimonas sp. K1W22B-7 TaxID=2303331 RepID=UPI000E331ADC|nr:hypothetical protein [Solimonas sp. K1W22B-7]AXQ30313.1 hypothetical protein D0B54_17270 [Solimonas sp. K1W22B-7]